MKFRLICALVVACAAAVPAVPVRASAPCSAPGYAYAGLIGSHGNQFGIAATLSATRLPVVEDGHVAAWVGVGGPYEGPGGTPEWLQVGLNSGRGSGNHLYYEYAAPGVPVTYVDLKTEVPAGTSIRVAVLRTAAGQDTWRVWVNNKPASDPISLPKSGGRLTPVATAENWDGGTSACNTYAYSFDSVRIARQSGGVWRPFTRARVHQDIGNRFVGSVAGFSTIGGPVVRAPSGVDNPTGG